MQQKLIIRVMLLLFPLFFIAFPASVSAHGSGAFIEKQVGDYLIDIGYEPDILRAGESVRFDFDLYNTERERERTYSEVWVRVEKEGGTILAGGIRRQEVGRTTLLYSFPGEGEYVLDVSYRYEGQEIAQAVFPLSVEARDSSRSPAQIQALIFLTGLALGAGLFILKRRIYP